MLRLALQYTDSIALLLVSMLIYLLQFLIKLVFRSTLAVAVWLAAFVDDVVRMRLLLRDHHKTLNDPLSCRAFHDSLDRLDLEPYWIGIRETVAMYLYTDVLSADLAAEAIDTGLPAKCLLAAPRFYMRSSRRYVMRVWQTLATAAVLTPHNHRNQGKLVDLILALARRPAVIVYGDSGVLKFWDAMPDYNTVTAVFGRETLLRDPSLTRQTNLMAFFARVQATGLPYGFNFGFVISLSQLDVFHSGCCQDKILWPYFWIHYCGEYLWWGLCKDRSLLGLTPNWNLWMGEFYRLATDGQNSRYTRMVAFDCFQTMSRLLASAPNPKFDDMGQKRWELYESFSDPIAPEIFEEGWSEMESDEAEDDERAMDIFLQPIGGFMPYANVTPEMENEFARAA